MLRNKLLKLIYRVNSYLSTSRAGTIFLPGLRYIGKNLILRVLVPHKLFLLKVNNISLYIKAGADTLSIYFAQPFEPSTTLLFKQAIKPGGRVLDIGAQFGYFSLIAAKKIGRRGKVYAFEPAPSNFELLVKNIQMNKYNQIIHPLPKAVGKKRGKVKFFIYRDSDSHSMYRHPQAPIKETISVDCLTIDEFLGGQPVDVIKMDIEGNEPYALEGMKKTISKSPNPILFTELAPAYLQRAGAEPEDFLRELWKLGFTVQLIDEKSRSLKPITKEVFWGFKPDWRVNIYCTKRKKKL